MILLVGYAALCAALKHGPRHWLEILGLSFASGCTIVSLLLFLFSLAGSKPSLPGLVGIAVAGILLLAAMKRRKAWITPSIPARRHQLEPVSVLGLASLGLVLVSVMHASNRAGWPILNEIDSFAIWLFKAKWVALKPLHPLPPEFVDPGLSYSHQDYPLGFPFLVAGLYAMAGRIDDGLVEFILVPLFLSLIAIIYSAVRRQHRRAIAAILTAIFAAAPAMTVDGGSAVAETMLIATYAGALSLLLRWMEIGQRGDLLLAGLLAAGAAFSKNEGLAMLPVLGIAAFAWAIVQSRNGQTPALRSSLEPGRAQKPFIDFVNAATITLIAITPWLIFRMSLPRTHEDYGGKLMNPAMMIHNLPRLSYVLPAFCSWMFDAARVGLLWYLLLICALLSPGAFKRGPVLLLWFILLIQLALYLTTFVITPWPVQQLLPMISARLLTQASPPAALLIALHLRELNWPIARPAAIKSAN